MPGYTENFNFKLPLETEYYSINTVNENTSAIDAEINKRGRREYLLAAPDSPQKEKARADVVCTALDCFEKLTQIIADAENGDTIRFAKGTFDYYAPTAAGIIVNKKLRFAGSGISNTALVQKGLASDNTSGAALFSIRAADVIIEDMMLVDCENAENSFSLIELEEDGFCVRGAFFIQKISATSGGRLVRNNTDSRFCRIQDCRIYRRISAPTRPMIDLSQHAFSGVIGGVINSGMDGIIIKFNNQSSQNHTAVFGCAELSDLT